MSALDLSVANAVGVVVSLDAAATPVEQHGLGLLTALLVALCLAGAQAADRAVVLWCVAVSAVCELSWATCRCTCRQAMGCSAWCRSRRRARR